MCLTKTTFREHCLVKMKSLPTSTNIYRKKMINRELQSALKGFKGKSILFYYPLGFEADIRETITKTRQTSKTF